MSKHSQTKLLGYSHGAMILHWLIALLIVINLAGGFLMVRFADISESNRFFIFQWHKTLGLLVLFLTLARIAWRVMNKPPKKGPMLKIEAFAASAVSIFFYVLMLVVPVVGWLVVSTTNVRIPTFLFLNSSLPWPNLPIARNEVLSHLALNAHMLLAYSFVILLFLHVAGAVKHSLIDRQAEFSRMLPTKRLEHLKATAFSWPVMLLVLLIPALVGVIIAQRQTIAQFENRAASTVSAPSVAQSNNGNWVINMDNSQLGYSLDFSGAAKQGKVGNWHADVTFSPDDLGNSKANIVILANSISYEDSFVSGSIAEADGLDPVKYPEIHVALSQFSREGDHFIGKGIITIRGISQPVEVPFQFSNDNGIAKVTGSAKIERLLFGIGAENDGDGSWLGKVISVAFSLEAQQK